MAKQGICCDGNNILIQKAQKVHRQLKMVRPMTKKMLQDYVKVFLGIDVPGEKICQEHCSPLDYLWHSFNADFAEIKRPNADAVIWANRGGGKTELAAAATLLDCIFKAGCQTRILAGSGEQAGRMYEYLTNFIHARFEHLLAGPVKKESCRFTNGSAVEVLMQSETSVRGQHVQKLRCDEVELFEMPVFAAAKFTTMSKGAIIPAIESISTMHRPYGIMHKIVTDAAARNEPVFKWCIWETIERCVERNCSQCPLWGDCRGAARQAAGFLKIDDCITTMKRASRAGWESEMLCRRPSLENVVFDEFEPAIHIKAVDYNPNWPLYRAIDFGFVNPFVCLWIQVDGEGAIFVVDEYVRSRATIEVHAEEIKKRTPVAEERVAGTFCDPAGNGSEQSSGQSQVRQLRGLGINVRFRRSGILDGIEHIRSSLKAGDGRSRFVVSPNCPRLIEALQCFHYPEGSAVLGTPYGDKNRELPVKDGVYDHPIDALRYFFVNYTRPARTISRSY